MRRAGAKALDALREAARNDVDHPAHPGADRQIVSGAVEEDVHVVGLSVLSGSPRRWCRRSCEDFRTPICLDQQMPEPV